MVRQGDQDGLHAMEEESSRGGVRWAVAVQALTQLLAGAHCWEQVVHWERVLLGVMGSPDIGPWGEMWRENQERLISAHTSLEEVEEALEACEEFEDEAHRWLEKHRDSPLSQEWWCLANCLTALKVRVGLLIRCGRQDEIEELLAAAKRVPGMASVISIDPADPPPGLPTWKNLRCVLLEQSIFLRVSLVVVQGHRLVGSSPRMRELQAGKMQQEVEDIIRMADSGWGNPHLTQLWKRHAQWNLSSALREGGYCPERKPPMGERDLTEERGLCLLFFLFLFFFMSLFNPHISLRTETCARARRWNRDGASSSLQARNISHSRPSSGGQLAAALHEFIPRLPSCEDNQSLLEHLSRGPSSRVRLPGFFFPSVICSLGSPVDLVLLSPPHDAAPSSVAGSGNLADPERGGRPDGWTPQESHRVRVRAAKFLYL